jgi:predicted nucleotidyltransferase
MNQLLQQNEIELMVCFFPKLVDLTSKEIETKSGYSHESTFRILKGLVAKKCLVEKKVGKTNVYEFIKERDLTYQVFTNYMTKKRLDFKQKHSSLYKWLYEFLNKVNPEGPAVVFGSFAKGTETKNSDVDILLVKNKNDAKTSAQVFKTKYGINLQPVVVKPSDFKNIKKDNLQFWNDLIEFGIVLDGLDLFFKEVYL